ncbi:MULTISPECIES: xylulokinase [unclassified Sulfitobacter]|nr:MULTISPECIES: FGGY family carbohydrate kinase [unclassified Sulfitobacter]KZX97197.1 hypothetical protein A3722_13960 [Sulfitobacter sp. HI0027]KZX97642.1 hypothetical protein A3720_17905 [Sulfitobacter sp. HI0021]
MADNDCFLGLDLGTSSLKAVLTDRHGAVLAEASAHYPTLRPQIGWSEQDPADWLTAMTATVAELYAKASQYMEHLVAIGFCSAAHLPVLLDADGQVVRPAILWSDQRSTVEVDWLIANHGPKIRQVTLNQPSCTWTLPQLAWVSGNEPESMARTVSLLSSKDYLIYLLTGQHQMDLTSAVATLLYDVGERRWDLELCVLAGLSPEALPQVVEPTTCVGKTGDGAKSFGLPKGVAVISGALDSAAEIVVCAGRTVAPPAVIRVGSSAAILAPGKPVFKQGVLNYPHAVMPGHYYQAGTNAGAVALQWVRQLAGGLDHSEVDAMVKAAPAGADGLLFHPYLQGERAPYWNPDMRGSFSGIHTRHDIGYFVRAVMEGVAFSLRDCIQRLELDLSHDVPARVAGGVTRGQIWPQILADVLGRPLETVDHAESALGAAFIAMWAKGGPIGIPEVSARTTIRPDLKKTDLYSEMFGRYQRWADFMDREARRGACP